MGFINEWGTEEIPLKYDGLGESKIFTYGLIAVSQNGKWGVINRAGNEVVPFKYQEMGYYSGGFITFKQNNKWGYIDRRGKEVIAARFDEADSFWRGDSAEVVINGREMMIGKPTASTLNTQQPTTSAINTQQNTYNISNENVPGLKGKVDPDLVGTWQYHDDGANFNTYYIFRADGTYDIWSDMMTSKAPPPNYKNLWRFDGDLIELLPEGTKEVVRLKLFKRNDPQTNKPALVIQWQAGKDYYRSYYPTEAKNLWAGSNSNTASKNPSNVAAVKLAEPPVRLNGIVDLSIIGLWKTALNNIDYFMELKADGTDETWSSTNPKRSKGYWRIDNGYFEVVFEGNNNKVDRFKFAKVNDLAKGKPTIVLVSSVYYPVTEREMWK